MPVVVTRPAEEARGWVQALAGHGIAAFALPLIGIAPAPDPAGLEQARAALASYRAVMFVSGNAVRGFFAEAPDATDAPGALPADAFAARAFDARALDARGAALAPSGLEAQGPAAPRAWAPGPGTAEALRAAGVPAHRIDQPPADAPQFDSEALWSVVAPQVLPGDRVLLVRGAGADGQGAGREWLSRQLAAAGAAVDVVVAYARALPRWSAADRDRARAALADGSLWLLSSSEAVHNLRRLLPEADLGTARALATHPRIAAAARAAGFGRVGESRPSLRDLVASIESSR